MAELNCTKQCKHCGGVFPPDQMGRNQSAKSGFGASCIECKRAADREKTNRHRAKDVDAAKLRERAEHLRNREQRNAYSRQWRRDNRAARAEYQKAWVADHLAYFRVKNAQRRARKLANGGRGYTLADLAELRRLQRGKCAVCRKALGERYDVDHIEPLSKGGLHDRLNIQLLCVTCNRRKHAKDPVEYMQSLGFLL